MTKNGGKWVQRGRMRTHAQRQVPEGQDENTCTESETLGRGRAWCKLTFEKKILDVRQLEILVL
jgi:hypothetical protein